MKIEAEALFPLKNKWKIIDTKGNNLDSFIWNTSDRREKQE